MASPAQADRPLTMGFSLISSNDFGLAQSVGSQMVRLDVNWYDVAPSSRPANFDASNPDDPAYNWSATDARVRAARAAGQKIMLTIDHAPTWAEGADRDPNAARGTWRPSPSAFGRFATAIARRYSGSHPDPLDAGRKLPKVRYWQGWNEPNLALYLSPLYVKSGNGFREVGTGIFRQLTNAFYSAVKKVDPTNTVILGGLAPYGDPYPGGSRIMPVKYLYTLLCLNRYGKRVCNRRTDFDIIDHHPYGVRGPFSHALNANDAAIPDVNKLRTVVKVALARKTVYPLKPKRTWVTEFSWDSSPPDPDGVPVATQARWLSESLYEFWRQKVDSALWYQLRDSLPNPSYDSTYQSGVFFHDDSRKPSAQTFRFPFVVRKARAGHVRFWGRAPASGRVTIERQSGSAWSVVKRFRAQRGHVFFVSHAGEPGTVYRAQAAGVTSAGYQAPTR